MPANVGSNDPPYGFIDEAAGALTWGGSFDPPFAGAARTADFPAQPPSMSRSMKCRQRSVRRASSDLMTAAPSAVKAA